MSTLSKNGWFADRLKDVAEINSYSLSAGTDPNHIFRYLEISNVDYFGVIDDSLIEWQVFEQAPSRARRCVRNGDVIVSSVRPNLQAIAHFQDAGDKLVCSTGFNVVSPNTRIIDSRFLYFYLISESTRQNLEAVAKGVGYPAIDDKDFKASLVQFPPLDEQERIVMYLNASCEAIDQAVETKKKQLETLDDLRNSIIQTAITKGFEPNVELKDSGVDWLGDIPRHWRVARIKRHAKMIRGKFSHRPRNDPVLYDGPFPFIQTGNIASAEKYITEYNQTLNSDGLAVSRMFPKGTIVMSIAANIGDVAIMNFEACFPDSIIGFVPDHHLYPDFLFYLLKCMKPVMLRSAIITTQLNINYVRIGSNYCPIPPYKEQEAIAREIDHRMDEIRRLSDMLSKQIETLTAYRKSLIHECITGKHQIDDDALTRVRANV